MNLVISWSACVLCDPICLNMVSKGQFVLCLVALDHSKSLTSPFSESHLQKGFGAWSPGLEHDGEDGEDDDLDGGPSCVPVWAADSILQQRRLNCITLGFMWVVVYSMFIALGALLKRSDVFRYCWCLRCLIGARVEYADCDRQQARGWHVKAAIAAAAAAAAGVEAAAPGTGAAAAFTAEIPRPWAEPSRTCPTRRSRLLPERNLLLLSNVYNDPTSSCILPSFLKFLPWNRCLCDKPAVTLIDPIWSTPSHSWWPLIQRSPPPTQQSMRWPRACTVSAYNMRP